MTNSSFVRAPVGNEGGTNRTIQDISYTTAQYASYVRMFTVPGFIIIGCVGTVANTLNVITFLRMRLTDSVSVAFFFLSLFDLGYTFTETIDGVTQVLMTLGEDVIVTVGLDPVVVFVISGNLLMTFYGCSTGMICWIAVQRCCCVAFPFTFQNIFTVRRTAVVIFFLCLFSLSNLTALLSNYRAAWLPISGSNSSAFQLLIGANRMTIVNTIGFIDAVCTVLAQFVIVFCTAVLILFLRHSKQFRKSYTAPTSPKKGGELSAEDSPVYSISTEQKAHEMAQTKTVNKDAKDTKTKSKSKTSNRQLVLSVTLISAMFTICGVPRLSMHIIRIFFTTEYDTFGANAALFMIGDDLRAIFELINASMNLLIYTTVNSRFRTAFTMQIMTCGKKH